MILLDDIGGLNHLIANQKTAEAILSKQVRHVNQMLPYFLGGILITGFIFLVMMVFALPTKLLYSPIHFTWVIYHSFTIIICWYLWKKALADSTKITHSYLKKIFFILFISLLSANIFGLVFYIILKNSVLGSLVIEPNLFYIWIVYHSLALYLCYRSWKDIDKVIDEMQNGHSLSPIGETLGANNLHFRPETNHQADYLASYTAYRVLFTCMMLLGCLWAIAVAKVLSTDIDLSVSLFVLIGLNFTIISAAMSSIGIFRQVLNAFAIPSLLTWSTIFFYINDYQLIVLSLVVIVFVLTHCYFAKNHWLNSIRTIEIYLENTQLVSRLESKSKQLQRVSAAKTQFLAAASHDLRQPAHALNLFIETLSRTKLDDKQRSIVEYAKNASQSSSDMLNSILDYSHLESGEMIPNIVATDLDAILQHLVDEFSAEAALKGISLHYKKTNLCVATDPSMLSLILRNFLSNALRYTTKGGVLIGVRYVAEQNQINKSDTRVCRIAVWDTGSGIKEEEIEGVFDSFHQLERNNQTNQGLGLGLSIAKGLARLLDTPIHVKSVFNRGSQFYIDVPTCKFHEKADKVGESFKTNKISKVSILVVEDDDTVLVSMKLLLESWGYKVLSAHNVQEASKQYRLHTPQLVITDYQLAELCTGVEVLTVIKSMAALMGTDSSLQCLILTGDTNPKILKIAKNLEVALLHKPITPLSLRNKLKELVSTLSV